MLGGPPPFVGREKELGWLEDSLLDAQRGRPHLAFVAGEAGVGKSRLAREFSALARRSGVRVCTGRGHETLRLAYLPFVEALQLRLEPGLQHLLDNTKPFRSFPSQTPGSDAATKIPWPGRGERERLSFFLEASRLLIGLARQQPTLLVLEDLHWADAASLDLLSYLVSTVDDAFQEAEVPILIVGTYRPIDAGTRLARTLARLERESFCQVIELQGLEESGTQRLVERMGMGRASHQLVATLSQATQGNPLFLQEALRHLADRGQLKQHDGYVFTAVPEVELELPADLNAALSGRVRRVSTECRRVLTLASFLGDTIELQLLSAVSGQDPESLTACLEEAARHGLLVAEDPHFRFQHPLMRHLFLQEPSAARQRRIHLRIAEMLERHHADELADRAPVIAQHLLAAGPEAEFTKVLEYARRACERATALFAWGEAARYLAAATSRAESDGALSAKERGDLHFEAGRLYHYDWDPGPCREHYEKAIAAYREAGDNRGLAAVLDHETRAALALGATSYGRSPALEPLEEMLGQLGDDEPQLRALISYTMSEACWAGRQPEKAEELAHRAFELGRQLKDESVLRNACLALGLAQHQSLRVGEALESWQDCLVHARRADDLWLENAPRQRICMALTQLGRLDEAQAAARDAVDLARRTQDAGETSFALANAAILATAQGEFEAAEAHAREALTMVYRSRYPWSGALALWAVACSRAQQGDTLESADALELLGEPGRIFEDAGPATRLFVTAQRALVEPLEEGAPRSDASQLSDLANAVKLLGTDGWLLWLCCALVEIADRRGEPDLARHPASILSMAFEQCVVLTTGWVFLIPRVVGVAAALEGRWQEAEDRFEVALRCASEIGAQPELGRTCLDYARMLVQSERGDHGRVKELLGRACDVFAAHRMHPFLSQAVALGQSLELDSNELVHAEEADPDRLSHREVDILRRLAGGQADEEIGEELMLRPQTVSQHVGRIFEKIEVEGRTEAAGWAFQQGLLNSPEHETSTPIVILVTDLEGFTPLVERLGDARARKVIHHHNHILRTSLRTHSGSEITHTGDGIMASFRTAAAAIQAAQDMLAAFRRYNLEHPEDPLQVRIGLSAGRPLVTEDRLFGSAINAGARICSCARPGSILVSETVRELVGSQAPCFASRGPVALKGFSERMWLYELQAAGGKM